MELQHILAKGSALSFMQSVTRDMKYRLSLLEYAKRNGVSRASRRYNRARSCIYFWRSRYDGTLLILTQPSLEELVDCFAEGNPMLFA
jgi:hypothetical protein